MSYLLIPVGVIFLYTLTANLLSWSLGVNNVACYAAKEGLLPPILAKTDKRGMPIGANITNGIIASAVVLVAPFIPSEDVFWSFFALNMVTLLLSYIMLFPAFRKLREIDPDTPRPFRVSGGRVRLALMTFLPMLLVILAVIFAVVPFSRAELADKLPLLLGTLFAIGIGEFIAAGTDNPRRSNRRLTEGGSV